MQAAQNADFAVRQFSFLHRLLFVHGRQNYINKAEMVLYCMYKNAMLTFPQVFFAFFNGFSGHSFYDDLYIANFNFLFTAVPYLARVLFDQDVNPRIDRGNCREKMPWLY